MNVRPIDGVALYKAFREELKKHPVPEAPGLGRYRAQVWLEAAGFFITMLTKAPTIEAEPVRHGRWEEYQVPHIVCCSECDWGTGVQDKYNYCPNCGAKMDLEEERHEPDEH